MIYPWQSAQWAQLQQAHNENRFPHALLLAGIAGIGKREFATLLTRYLLCQQPALFHAKCQCHSCRLITGCCHPDVLCVAPEKPGHAIKVDQIRDMTQFIYQSGLGQQRRVILIAPADAMNLNASNALLKTLEEPPPHSHLLLVSDQPGRLPATVSSRCQRIQFARPTHEAALAWLKEAVSETADPELLLGLARGAPCAALALSQSDAGDVRQGIITQIAAAKEANQGPLQAAASIKEADYAVFLSTMRTWLSDLVKLQLGMASSALVNRDHLSALGELVSQTGLQHNLTLLSLLMQLERALQTGLNLNKRLMMENVLIQWSEKRVGEVNEAG